jgi:hypothetical protein
MTVRPLRVLAVMVVAVMVKPQQQEIMELLTRAAVAVVQVAFR